MPCGRSPAPRNSRVFRCCSDLSFLPVEHFYEGFSAWDCELRAPWLDAAADFLTYTLAAALRSRDCPWHRACPPLRWLPENADRISPRPLPRVQLRAAPAHPAIACRSVPHRRENPPRRSFRSAAHVQSCPTPVTSL